MKMFAIYDKKAEGFNTPFFQPTFGTAERMFQDACQDEKTLFSKHPSDFSLYHLGDWNQQSGLLETNPQPKLLCEAPVRS